MQHTFFGLRRAWNSNPSNRLLRWGIVCLLVLAGCEQDASRLTVDESAAHNACTAFLTAWKEGKKPTDLAHLAPAIIGNDSDWEIGRTLESFEVLPEQRTDGANLHFTVRRTIKTHKGDVKEQEVGYVVGTSPTVTVFRTDQ